ncbi:hypothetical protein NECAME_13433 [Necator americanus]|uniref:Uncharacterized protein n=1 Tax=Necator americanus TaxID=51031 RepID=W2SY47_NECAM|nr:hypothetical protein NECAME_13433 [Necator americanus]ETN73781.1 hypothetical protein NECAME_13433 [Necator americanus]
MHSNIESPPNRHFSLINVFHTDRIQFPKTLIIEQQAFVCAFGHSFGACVLLSNPSLTTSGTDPVMDGASSSGPRPYIRLTSQLKNATRPSGGEVRFRCEAIGTPPLSFTKGGSNCAVESYDYHIRMGTSGIRISMVTFPMNAVVKKPCTYREITASKSTES